MNKSTLHRFFFRESDFPQTEKPADIEVKPISPASDVSALSNVVGKSDPLKDMLSTFILTGGL